MPEPTTGPMPRQCCARFHCPAGPFAHTTTAYTTEYQPDGRRFHYCTAGATVATGPTTTTTTTLAVGQTVRVRRYRHGRLTMNMAGTVTTVGLSGFAIRGTQDGRPFHVYLAHNPTGQDVENPIEQVVTREET